MITLFFGLSTGINIVDLVNPEKLFFIGNRNFEVAELINLPFEEKTVILYKNKKTSIIHQFKYKVKKSINRRGEK